MRNATTYRVISPGRVNLIGEHTDYSGGHVFPMATDLHTQLDARPAETVTIRSEAFDEERSFDPAVYSREGDWVDYVKGCYAVLEDEGYQPGGFSGKLSGDLPLGSGLSSSASLELAILRFLDDVYDLGLSRERLAKLGQRVENDFVGVSCGIMDQFAVALGREGYALHIDTETLAYEAVPVPDGVEVVVYHTGVERGLVDSAYNDRRETIETALSTLGYETSTEVREDDLEALSPVQRQRLGFVTRENDRVLRAKEALQSGDLERFGDLLVDAHRDIATNYEASCPELDYVVDAAIEHGAYGARLTGAGWGGAAIALVDSNEIDAFTRSLDEAYQEHFPERDPRYYSIAPSAGVSISLSDTNLATKRD